MNLFGPKHIPIQDYALEDVVQLKGFEALHRLFVEVTEIQVDVVIAPLLSGSKNSDLFKDKLQAIVGRIGESAIDSFFRQVWHPSNRDNLGWRAPNFIDPKREINDSSLDGLSLASFLGRKRVDPFNFLADFGNDPWPLAINKGVCAGLSGISGLRALCDLSSKLVGTGSTLFFDGLESPMGSPGIVSSEQNVNASEGGYYNFKASHRVYLGFLLLALAFTLSVASAALVERKRILGAVVIGALAFSAAFSGMALLLSVRHAVTGLVFPALIGQIPKVVALRGGDRGSEGLRRFGSSIFPEVLAEVETLFVLRTAIPYADSNPNGNRSPLGNKFIQVFHWEGSVPIVGVYQRSTPIHCPANITGDFIGSTFVIKTAQNLRVFFRDKDKALRECIQSWESSSIAPLYFVKMEKSLPFRIQKQVATVGDVLQFESWLISSLKFNHLLFGGNCCSMGGISLSVGGVSIEDESNERGNLDDSQPRSRFFEAFELALGLVLLSIGWVIFSRIYHRYSLVKMTVGLLLTIAGGVLIWFGLDCLY